MKRWLVFLIFFIIIGSAQPSRPQEKQPEVEVLVQPQAKAPVATEDDRELMEDAEMLELMELLEEMEFIQEVDLFMEGNTDEKEE
jgi:hypothetical protein